MSTLTEATRRLRGRYAEGLPAKWRVVESALAQLALAGADADAEDTLRRIAHQVRGSAASYGFVDIDKSASRLEHAEDRRALERAAKDFAAALRAAYAAESTGTIRALLIDDDLAVGFVMQALLAEEKLGITQVTSAAAALAELQHGPWHLIFVDLVLPDADGRSLLTHLRSLELYRETPVVVLSAKTGALVKNECAIYGVDDYVEKPIDAATFAVRVTATLARTRRRQTVNDRDPVTGLPNRLGFRRALEQLPLHRRQLTTLAILDIDHFAAYADEQGREAGEQALALVVSLLRACVREQDLLGRWGDAEFLVALPGLHAFDAIELLGRASEALRAKALGSVGAPLTLLAGVTELSVDESLDQGLLRADQLLQRSKRPGRGSWYTDTLTVGDGDRPRILVAEDDLDIAALLLRDLADDYDVTHVGDGEAALTAALANSFDLVLLDYQMPQRDGLEVVRDLRARESYRDKPILLLTAVGSDVAVEAAFEAGADDYIAKPYRRRALLARLARHLGRAPAPADKSEHAPKPEPKPANTIIDAQVTALFCDISDFSGISARMRPREVLELLNTYFPVIAKLVRCNGGKLEKYIGDAVLAIWGSAAASDDDALHALETAVDIQQAVSELSMLTSPPLRVHIGLNTGLVAVGTIGNDDFGQFATIGDTTNLTSRLCDLAAAGEIVISGETATALRGRGRWPLRGPERVMVEGRGEPVTIYRVRWQDE